MQYTPDTFKDVIKKAVAIAIGNTGKEAGELLPIELVNALYVIEDANGTRTVDIEALKTYLRTPPSINGERTFGTLKNYGQQGRIYQGRIAPIDDFLSECGLTITRSTLILTLNSSPTKPYKASLAVPKEELTPLEPSQPSPDQPPAGHSAARPGTFR